MAEFSQNRGKRRDGEALGSAVDFLLANARLVLGVGGAAVLGIATLAVKRVRWGWPEWARGGGSARGYTCLCPTSLDRFALGSAAAAWGPAALISVALQEGHRQGHQLSG